MSFGESGSFAFGLKPFRCTFQTISAAGRDRVFRGVDHLLPWNPHHHTFLNNLGATVFIRFQQSGRMEDMEEAITCHREALALCPRGHPNRAASLNNFANAVSTRFEKSRSMEDLEEAITCHREALTLRPHGHPARSSSLINLTNAVSTRFEQLGKIWRRRSDVTAKQLLSFLRVIPITQLLFVISVLLYPLTLSSWEG